MASASTHTVSSASILILETMGQDSGPEIAALGFN